ncbi:MULTISPECIES: WD40 domain-containing protein [Calothrix]|uniref:Novel STAND NTPase 1 domain-containing protein n=2 Tax=Calothrix TaxID=1186 RepID=A0ABR8AGB0_9CYAN|nr:MULTISPECIES: hypothetical protein [Calothrix]MBD2198235.1 hypothetical protein [Calothrix parietina FACHB-288]MBD2226537.1 hypothetical protein [Calothrix anomala FACHB-343]
MSLENNESSLQELNWAISTSQGEFSLILALCNAASLRKSLVQRLQASNELAIREITLDKSVNKLFQAIQDSLGEEHPQALMVSGLEAVNNLEQVLTTANQVREEFRKNFHFPLVLWITDEVLQKLIRLAPDLQSWATTVEFAIASHNLIEFIEETADDVFTKVLNAGAGRYLDSNALNLQVGSPRRIELESAWHELQNRRLSLNFELEASLEFMLGRATSSSMEQSRQHYDRSLELFNQCSLSPQTLERQGCLLYSLSLWWGTYALLHHPEQDYARGFTKDYLQQCIQAFEQANRQDLVAKFINALGLVLQLLQQWEDLEAVANRALALHQTYPDTFKLARAYGFIAEVAIHKSAWNEAKQAAEQALSLVNSVQIDESHPNAAEMQADLDWERSYHRGWYLLALARSQSALNQPEAVLQTLETARVETNAQYDPDLYIRILAELRDSYFNKGEYLTAFHIKQEQRSLEQQYGFRAFIGAGRLQAQQAVNNPALPFVEHQATVASEIAASGRQQDINRLIVRMGRPDHKLTVIHGQSGVGKSSILQAGLIPALRQKPIGTRDVLPVLQQVYPDWLRELSQRLAEALADTLYPLPINTNGEPTTLDSTTAIINQLQKHDDYDLLTVLIFDQFEEFFFVYKDPSHRRPFYEFLRDCLDTPYVKVILSLREDYLHYLLECNNRLADFEVINNNILDKDILYYLDNFSPEDAKSIIQTLTEKTQLVFETPLIDELVHDLARDLGEVRPIELQVVGAQLQTERITKLEQYQEYGPKEKFVGRFLEEIVKDCGSENEQIAKLVLYLLTDENNTRPLKTRADLGLELEVKSEKLDLVLEILVKSGLVFKVPAVPSERYQLVHDYLVPFVRQQQSERLIKELEKEREQRKLTEAKLNEVLQKQLIEARRGLVWKVSVGVITGALAIFLPVVLIAQNNAQLDSMTKKSTNLLSSNKDLEALLEGVKAGKQLQKWWSIGVKPEIEMQVKTVLQDVAYGIRERNSIEGYKTAVTCVSFSADSQIGVAGSDDGMVKIWQRNGKVISSFQVHNKKVTTVSFSPDGQMIVAGTVDGKVVVSDRNGKEISNFPGHEEEITSISFSPDAQKLISGSKDKTIKISSLDGKITKTLKGHKDSINSVVFSPDGQLIASGSEDTTVKFWNIDGKLIKTLDTDDSVKKVAFSPNSQTIVSVSDFSQTKLWRRDGSLLNNIDGVYGDAATFSLDGKTIAFADFTDNAIYIQIYQINTGKVVENFQLKGHGNNVTNISISPDLQMLASGSEDRTVKLWNLEKKSNFNKDWQSTDTITDVSFSPNGQLIASVSNGNKVQLWQQNGTLKTTLPGHNSKISFSTDSQMLATASEESVVYLWQRDGTFLKTIQGNNLSISHDKKIIGLVKDDNSVELAASDGKHIATLKGHKDTVNEIIFSPDSKTIATVSKKTIKLWKINGTLITTLNSDSSFDDSSPQIVFSPDSKTIATVINNNIIKIWQIDGTLITTINSNGDVTLWSFSPQKKILVIEESKRLKFLTLNGKVIKTIELLNSSSYASVSTDQELMVIRRNQNQNQQKKQWELWRNDGTFIATLMKVNTDVAQNNISFINDGQTIISQSYKQTTFWNRNGNLLAKLHKNVIAYSSDLQILVTQEEKNIINLWKPDSTLIKSIKIKNNKSNIRNISFSNNEQNLVIETDTGAVEIWDNNGDFIQSITALNDRNVKRLMKDKYDEFQNLYLPITFDNKNLALRTQENQVQLWENDGNYRKKWFLKKTIENQGNLVGSVQFINENTIAIVSTIDMVKLWKIPNNIDEDVNLLTAIQGHKNQITSLSISPKNQIIASASKDNTVKLWQYDGKLLKTFTEHKDNVNSISFTPDGKLIASASDDKTVKIWQPNGKIIESFDKHENNVNSVSFSPNGKMIASGSKDRTVRVWSLDGNQIKPFNTEEPVNKVSFSPNGEMISSASDKSVKLSSIDGSLLASFPDRLRITDISFSPDGKSIATLINKNYSNEIAIWSFELNHLLQLGCNAARDYLQNNPKAESDRHLCDDIYNKK